MCNIHNSGNSTAAYCCWSIFCSSGQMSSCLARTDQQPMIPISKFCVPSLQWDQNMLLLACRIMNKVSFCNQKTVAYTLPSTLHNNYIPWLSSAGNGLKLCEAADAGLTGTTGILLESTGLPLTQKGWATLPYKFTMSLPHITKHTALYCSHALCACYADLARSLDPC